MGECPFKHWIARPSLTKELQTGCESIHWQVDELDIALEAREPPWYGVDEVELEKRRRWTSTARIQVCVMKKAGKARSANGMLQELMRVPNDPYQAVKSSSYAAQDNNDFIILVRLTDAPHKLIFLGRKIMN